MTGGIPLGQWSGGDATEQLRASIEESNRLASRQARLMIWLTVAILFLSIVMAIAAAIQVWLAFR
jgi:hypothetical protein